MTNIDRAYLIKQAQMYLKVQGFHRKNDLLYRMGTNTDVLTPKDITVIYDNEGWLTQHQRQRVIDFINKQLEIALENWVDIGQESREQVEQASMGLILFGTKLKNM